MDLVAVSPSPGLVLVPFDPRALRVWSEGTGAGVQRRGVVWDEALARIPRAAAILDGPQDGPCVAPDDCRMLASLRHAEPVRPREASAGQTRVVLATYGDGRVLWRDEDELPPSGALAATLLYPRMLRGGSVVASAAVNRDAVWRAGVVQLEDGRLAFAAGVMGLYAFAEALRAAGAVEGGYTDGGGSATLALANGWRVGHSERRPIASWLYVDAGALDAAGASATSDAVPWMAAGVLLLAAGAVALRHRA